MKQQKYIESKDTCIFMAKCVSYLGIGTNTPLLIKLIASFNRLALNKKALGFCGIYYIPTKLGKKLVKYFPNVSRVFSLPFIKISVNPKSKRAYQIWCKELSWITPEFAKIICDECDYAKIDVKHKGEVSWQVMKEEEHYTPFISELKFLLIKATLSLLKKK